MTEPREQLLTITEVSAWTKIPENTLRYYHQLTKAATPQFVGPRAAKIGRRLFWRESDVQEWIDQQFAASQ